MSVCFDFLKDFFGYTNKKSMKTYTHVVVVLIFSVCQLLSLSTQTSQFFPFFYSSSFPYRPGYSEGILQQTEWVIFACLPNAAVALEEMGWQVRKLYS